MIQTVREIVLRTSPRSVQHHQLNRTPNYTQIVTIVTQAQIENYKRTLKIPTIALTIANRKIQISNTKTEDARLIAEHKSQMQETQTIILHKTTQHYTMTKMATKIKLPKCRKDENANRKNIKKSITQTT